MRPAWAATVNQCGKQPLRLGFYWAVTPAFLMTGTGIVPDESFTLRAGDVVTIDIPGIGTLTNPVVLVGRDLDQERA